MTSIVSAIIGSVLFFIIAGLPAVLLTVYFLNNAKMVRSYALSFWLGAVTQSIVNLGILAPFSLSNPFGPFVLQAMYGKTTFSAGEVGVVVFAILWFVMSGMISIQYRYNNFDRFLSDVDSNTVFQYTSTVIPLVLIFLIDINLIQVLLFVTSVVFLNIHFNSVEKIKESMIKSLKPSLPGPSDIGELLEEFSELIAELGEILSFIINIFKRNDDE